MLFGNKEALPPATDAARVNVICRRDGAMVIVQLESTAWRVCRSDQLAVLMYYTDQDAADISSLYQPRAGHERNEVY